MAAFGLGICSFVCAGPTIQIASFNIEAEGSLPLTVTLASTVIPVERKGAEAVSLK